MTAGDLALTSLPLADGTTKIRPVLLLKRFPPFGDFLVCGVSSQIHQEVSGFDYVVAAGTPEFASSGLKVRLGYLAVLPESQFAGKIGLLPGTTLSMLLRRLSDFLAKPQNAEPESSMSRSRHMTPVEQARSEG